MEKNIIIFGAGKCGTGLSKRFGTEKVAFFCDNFLSEKESQKMGVPVINFQALQSLPHLKEYRIILSITEPQSMLSVSRQLNEAGISFENTGLLASCMHVYGDYPNLQYDYYDADDPQGCAGRLPALSIPLMEKMLSRKHDSFIGKRIDFFLYYRDSVFEAERILEYLQRPALLAYSTVYALSNRIIPIPDYQFGHLFKTDDSIWDQCEKRKDIPWSDSRAFWAGTLLYCDDRMALRILAEKFPEKIKCIWWNPKEEGKRRAIPMTDFMKYKYLIDVRGIGWTDRVKFLLAMRRPLLLVDRPFREYYFKDLVPMKHYIPVKEDMSDLIERIEYLDSRPDFYDEIVKNAVSFVKEHFTEDKVLNAMFEAVWKVCQ